MITALKKLTHAIKWPMKAQLMSLRTTMIQDRQWLASNQAAAMIIDRYLPMLSDDWEKAQVETISTFRDRLEKSCAFSLSDGKEARQC